MTMNLNQHLSLIHCQQKLNVITFTKVACTAGVFNLFALHFTGLLNKLVAQCIYDIYSMYLFIRLFVSIITF